MVVAASTVAIVAIAAAVIVVALLAWYLLPRGEGVDRFEENVDLLGIARFRVPRSQDPRDGCRARVGCLSVI